MREGKRRRRGDERRRRAEEEKGEKNRGISMLPKVKTYPLRISGRRD